MTARRILALGAVALGLGAGAAGAQEPIPSDMLLATLWNQRSVDGPECVVVGVSAN